MYLFVQDCRVLVWGGVLVLAPSTLELYLCCRRLVKCSFLGCGFRATSSTRLQACDHLHLKISTSRVFGKLNVKLWLEHYNNA